MANTENAALSALHAAAFGAEEGPQIAQLAESFLARPDTISISATRNGKTVGNVLFTPFRFEDHPAAHCYLLAPLGVLRDFHGCGVGRELMQTGIAQLSARGCDALFVLGIPDFYPKFGFEPTQKQTPYPDLLTVPQA